MCVCVCVCVMQCYRDAGQNSKFSLCYCVASGRPACVALYLFPKTKLMVVDLTTIS